MAEVPWVSAGDAVAKGDVIGPVGSTGMSTGPHVHFIVQVNGVAQDPLAYLA
jgi:murein DD-endopeptidase MepM/ murein hydrolase activator NlpD